MAIAKKPADKVIEATFTKIAEKAVANTNVAAAAVTAAASDMMKPFAGIQEKVRANAEEGIEKLRSQYATLKGNAEAATDKLEASVAAAHAGTREFNMTVLDLFRAQTNAGFEHMQSLFGAKSVADAVKLQQDFTKTQFEAIQTHSKHLGEIAKKVATDVVEPIKASMVLPFKA